MADAKHIKTVRCVVVSDSMDKSRVGRIDRLVKDKVTEKYLRKTSKIMFHDEKNETKVGDKVIVTPSRPYSARKCFNLVSIVP